MSVIVQPDLRDGRLAGITGVGPVRRNPGILRIIRYLIFPHTSRGSTCPASKFS
jgi:hypothetical protein